MNVKLFGALVDIAGTENLLLQSVSNANDLRNQFIELYPEAKTSKFLIAVNKKIVNENYSINESDEVALMPPFSGG
ncbi:MAG: MoaD/ThiS family protein [Bacteroidetes bacterium]|nr:MoaD/ThiS family protein [Bacteroidota bacterium]MBK9523679.1 MoaD/ThiS family protein [Bacteroidota bacterium]MBL0258700.1 MoaD/ThiS family protein [Bacteroidota bacterium]MBP6402313.1 MoaD/ThiS family protein [Bacteroidia bacterium]MBP6649258.1 MoaD/ThiS family protein [Bacteroidia bacterium]